MNLGWDWLCLFFSEVNLVKVHCSNQPSIVYFSNAFLHLRKMEGIGEAIVPFCSHLFLTRDFSEDFLSNMSLDSQLEWFNCFWIHTGSMLYKGQKAIIRMCLLHLCSVIAFKVDWALPLFLSGAVEWSVCSGARVSLWPCCSMRRLCLIEAFFSSWNFRGISSWPLFNLWHFHVSCWGKQIFWKVGI